MANTNNIQSSSAASASVNQEHVSVTDQILKRKSNDIAWEYGMLVDAKNLDKVKCKLCNKLMSGGAYRVKEHVGHIPGNVSKCLRATPDDQAKCRQAIRDAKSKKRSKQREEASMLSEVNVLGEDEQDDVEEVEGMGARKPPRKMGPIDRYASTISPHSSLEAPNKNIRQQNINDALFKERTQAVHQYVARWVYEASIPFNAIDNDSFKLLVEAVGQFGSGYKPPSQWQLREPLLKGEVERTRELLKKQEEEWATNGCSIMTDAWFDRKRRSIMNLCVNCKIGTTFLSSKESSDEAHTGQHIFEYVDKCIDQVGQQNVVQVVTDNATNNMAAAKLLKVKRPHIFWSSCATHTINLMLEGIGKLPKFKKVIDQGKNFTIFIYAHHKTLAMMRSFTKKRDIVRPEVTRFAYSFLSLQSLVEKKVALKAMFSSEAWENCKWSKTTKGKLAYTTAMGLSFWNGVTMCLKVFAPLVRVLRIVDGDRKPSMGFIYGELIKAQEEIKAALNNLESNYQPIIEIINAKLKDRLDTPLHVTAYLLNPFYYFRDSTIVLRNEVTDAAIGCVEIFHIDDIDMQNQIVNVELVKYKKKEGAFGKQLAIRGCMNNDDNYDPVAWWTMYGNQTPNLQRIATRILSLTTSSSGCERNWSAFEGIHTKKRNRLDATRLNNLVYVQFNAKTEKNIDVLLANDASNAQGWIVDGGDDDEEDVDLSQGVDEATGHIPSDLPPPRRSSRLRELHEDDFVSEDEEEENNEVEFESDNDQVVELYGEEELES